MVVTMVLHPAGDINDYYLIIGSHTLAIMSIPISLVGFWGVTNKMGTENILSITAFAIIAMGLVAAMMAGIINGLAYPMFLKNYIADGTLDFSEAVEISLHYGFTLNQAMALVYIGAVCLSIFLWSLAIVKNGQFPKWIGYFGILLGAGGFTLILAGINLTSVGGFRIFIFGSVTWVIIIGYLLIKSKEENPETLNQ